MIIYFFGNWSFFPYVRISGFPNSDSFENGTQTGAVDYKFRSKIASESRCKFRVSQVQNVPGREWSVKVSACVGGEVHGRCMVLGGRARPFRLPKGLGSRFSARSRLVKRCHPRSLVARRPLFDSLSSQHPQAGRWKSSPPIRHTKFPLSTFITIRCLCIINYIRDKKSQKFRDSPFKKINVHKNIIFWPKTSANWNIFETEKEKISTKKKPQKL